MCYRIHLQRFKRTVAVYASESFVTIVINKVTFQSFIMSKVDIVKLHLETSHVIASRSIFFHEIKKITVPENLLQRCWHVGNGRFRSSYGFWLQHNGI